MRYRFGLIAFLVVTMCSGLGASSAWADESSDIDEYTGTYRSTLTTSQARKEIDKSIDDLVDDMAFYKRPFARSKLENRTPPCIDLKISYSGGDVTVGCDDRSPASAALDGKRRHFKPSGGDPVKVQYALSNGKLVQKFYSENGVRTNTYSIQSGGKILKLQVEIQSSKLPRPLRYKRTFERR